ncbi:MAG: chemotaxis protein CheA [Candidatus Omnitrophica bacterium]|nr:chemotaxis protein CheA [Candidatus Omnitrophota bacterium]
MNPELTKYKETFLTEAKEHVGAMNKALLGLEKKPDKLELVSDIFREAHTLKSMAAAMEYNKSSVLCHAVEDVLDALRKKKIRLGDCVDALFESFDVLESTLKELKKGKPEIDTTVLKEKLQKISVKDYTTERSPAVEAVEKPASGVKEAGSEKLEAIEVKIERLDRLMNLAEELLINKMRLDGIKDNLQDPELTASVDSMSRLISELQYIVMQARLVPIGFVFNRFPRVVRDLAKAQKKEVNLETAGEDIELDRGVIDEISDSLIHLIRNAVDHGIETPDERKKTGKPLQGTIRLAATSTKNSAIIKVTDDGMGLDIDDIKSIAIKRGIISATACKEEIFNSIFSGVSTTKQVTQVSGRGFGVNIVKAKIDSINGSVSVDSEPKKGTTFTIEAPLTLAIIKALFVRVGAKSYAIPLVNIERLVTVIQKDIKGMLNYEAVVLNEEDIPIIRLDELFQAPSLNLDKQPIVIVTKGRERLGVAVDAVLATQDIVIKPLNKLVRENKYFSGSTIIGSGEVVLILDISNLMLTKKGGEHGRNKE